MTDPARVLAPARVTYRGAITSPERWGSWHPRQGDILVCTPPKSGTTRDQTILAMLVHAGPHLPLRLPVLSPWVDADLGISAEEVAAVLAQAILGDADRCDKGQRCSLAVGAGENFVNVAGDGGCLEQRKPGVVRHRDKVEGVDWAHCVGLGIGKAHADALFGQDKACDAGMVAETSAMQRLGGGGLMT